jgi:hypothetical protein
MFTGQSILQQVPKSSSCFRQTLTVPRLPILFTQNTPSGRPPQHFCRLSLGKDRYGALIAPVCASAGIFQPNGLVNVPDELKSGG